MCGIFGIIYNDNQRKPSEDQLRRSAELLTHRGPDDCGIYSEGGIGLVHTRLALVDLDVRSAQPMWDPTNRYCLIYNGEIYNFRELKEKLVAAGVPFRTTSDTEVLMQSLIVLGIEQTLPKLKGMFAFAFYDRQQRQVLLARDRFGIKPLLVYRDKTQLIFSSEVKAMGPWIELKPNAARMTSFLMAFKPPAQNASFFEYIDILPPGTGINLDVGAKPVVRHYGDAIDMIDPERYEYLARLSKEQIVDHVDELLQESVEMMLMADAPVGALCSGGVDSSLIMAMAARRHQNLAIFHANVLGPLSEFSAANELARHLKLDLLTVETRDEDFLELTPEVLWHYEQPYWQHPHSVPFLQVSKLVEKSGVKAVLTGEGSDECFLGYPRLAQEPLWEFYRKQIDRVSRIVRAIPKVGDCLWAQPSREHSLIGRMLTQFEIISNETRARREFVKKWGRQPDRGIRSLDLMTHHLRTLLHRNDTMGMAASIESRFPFLHEDLVRTAINLPYEYKIRFQANVWEKNHPFLRDKWVIRAVADRYLPKSLSQRKKLGFHVSTFHRVRIPKRYFQGGFVADFFNLRDHELNLLFENNNQDLEVRMMMLEAWAQIFIEGTSQGAVGDQLCEYAHF